MGTRSPHHLWYLLLTCLLCATVECSNRTPNPNVITLTFRNESEPLTKSPDSLLMGSGGSSDVPLVFCRGTKYPSDVHCDIGNLLEQDVFPANMVISSVNTAMPDPVRTGKVCLVVFNDLDTKTVKPLTFEEIKCGVERDITSEDSLIAPEGIDSMAVLPQFKVLNMTDLVLISYSGYGCIHRLKRFREAERGTKNPSLRGSFFKLDSFFCSIGFGVAEGRPETSYTPQAYYKYDGRRWRPSGIWPDFNIT